MSGNDGLTAFLRVLRVAVYKTTRALFYSILNVICAALLVASCLAPWRLCAMIFGWKSFKERLIDELYLDGAQGATFWRYGCVVHFLSTFLDCFVVPFAVLAFAVPTRTPYAFRILCRAWAVEDDIERFYYSVRGDFIAAGASAPLDLVGVVAAVACVFLPWPTCIFRTLSVWWKNGEIGENGEKGEPGWFFNLMGVYCAVYCFVTSLAEMPFAMASLALGIITPTRTMATLRVFGNHLYYRTSPKVQWTNLYGNVKLRSGQGFRASFKQKPVLFIDSLMMICFALLDWITAPALLIVCILGALRLPKMCQSGRYAIAKLAKAPEGSRRPGSPWNPSLWPWHSDVFKVEDVNKFSSSVKAFLYPINSAVDQTNVAYQVLYHSLHYSMALRKIVWTQFVLVLADVCVLPFAILAIFGVVHTKYFCKDVRGTCCGHVPDTESTLEAKDDESAVAFEGIARPSKTSADALTDESDDATRISQGEEKYTDSATVKMTIKHDRPNFRRGEGDEGRGWWEHHGYDRRVRESAVYHGVMTIVDILFLPLILFVTISIVRAPKMIRQLRNSFDNKARAMILTCTRNAVLDIVTLPFLLVVLSPAGMLSGRDKPLRRNISCFVTNDRSQRAAVGQGDDAVPIEMSETMANPKLDMTATEYHVLVLRQFGLIVLDVAVLPFAFIVFFTNYLWDHIWENLLGGYYSDTFDNVLSVWTVMKPITRRDDALMADVFRRIGKTAVLDAKWTPKYYLVDSRLQYHKLMITHAFIALHDMLLCFVALFTACCGFYRMHRIYSLVRGYFARIRLGMAVDRKKFHRFVKNMQLNVSQIEEAEGKNMRLLRQSYWRQEFRSALWLQFAYLVTDAIFCPIVVLAALISPHRIPNLCSIAVNIIKFRCFDCRGSVARDDPDLHEAMKASPSKASHANSDSLELSPGFSNESKGDSGSSETKRSSSQTKTQLSDWKNLPYWNGMSRMSHYGDTLTEENGVKHQYEDGFWHKLVLDEFLSGVIDLFYLIVALPAIVTLYRWDKLLDPFFRQVSARHIRRSFLRQSVRVILDIIVLPFAAVVFGSIIQAYPVVKELLSKMAKPCEALPMLNVLDVKSELVGTDGVSKAVLRFHFRCVLNVSAKLNASSMSVKDCRLRILGENGLWNSVKDEMGAMSATLGRSAMPILLKEENLNIESISRKMKKMSESPMPDISHHIDFTLTLILPMKRSTVLKKAKLLSCESFGLQLECISIQKKEQRNLIAAILPMSLVTAASPTQLDGYADLGQSGKVEEQIHVNVKSYNNPSSVAVARGTENSDEGDSLGPLYSETDLRDSFARVIILAFLRLCNDVLHFFLALIVLCLAPWRFAAIVHSLCEPKRRYPVRLAGKIIRRLHYSLSLVFDPACEKLTFAANKHAKQHSTSSKYLFPWMHRPLSEDHTYYGVPESINTAFRKHDKTSEKLLQELNMIGAPYAAKARELVEKRRALRYYTCIHWQLNRARNFGLFNDHELHKEDCENETLSYLFEELRISEISWRKSCERTKHELSRLQKEWEDEQLCAEYRCKKWGCWHHKGSHSRRLVRIFVILGLNDIAHLFLNLLLLATLYRLPAFFRDLGSIPNMSTRQAILVFFFKPSGSFRVRRIVHKHTIAIASDLMLLVSNVLLFIVVLLLVARLPQYVAYLPIAKSLKDLESHARECISESFYALWEILALITAWDSIKICIRACLFAFFMPAAGIADVVWAIAPSCLGDHSRTAVGLVAWISLFAGLLTIIFRGTVPQNINAIIIYSCIFVSLLFVCLILKLFLLPETRYIDRNRWSAPSIRLDRFPNIFALLQIPSEAGLLISLCITCFYQKDLLTNTPTVVKWPSIGEDSSAGQFMRIVSTTSIILGFVWVFIVSVPLAVVDETKRTSVQQSYFYSTTASLLNGPLFLPIAFGLLLPFHCESFDGLLDGIANSSTLMNNTSENSTAGVDALHRYTCWENDETQSDGYIGHATLIAMSAELFLVFLLTNIAAAVHERAENAAAVPTTERLQRGKDVGLDLIWSNAYTSCIRFIQVLLLGAVLVGILEHEIINEARLAFVILSFFLAILTPAYVLVCSCCSQQQKCHCTVVASVPWVPLARSFGLLSVFFVSLTVHVDHYLVFDSIYVIAIGLGLLAMLGVLISYVVRQNNKQLRQENLRALGFTNAFRLLLSIESELLIRKRGLDPKRYDRLAWSQRLASISSARHLAQAVIDFEDNILAENLRPSFIRNRKSQFVGRLQCYQTGTVFSRDRDFNAFSDVVKALKYLQQNICPPAMHRTRMSLVKLRFERTGTVPMPALGRILEFLGAPLYFKIRDQILQELHHEERSGLKHEADRLEADMAEADAKNQVTCFQIPSNMFIWLNPFSACFKYQILLANLHIYQLAMSSAYLKSCQESIPFVKHAWEKRFKPQWFTVYDIDSERQVLSRYLYPSMPKIMESWNHHKSDRPFIQIQQKRFERDLASEISNGIISSWYQ